MDKTPLGKFSIIVCAYNEEKIIGDKIEDILARDKNNDIRDIIVVDDYSSDNTFEMAGKYSERSDKLKVVKNAHKKGKWGGVATGIEHAQGSIICMTDVDVLFQDDTLEEAGKVFVDSAIGAVTASQKVAIIKDGVRGVPKINLYEKFRNFFRTIESGIDSTLLCHGQCLFFRKSCVRVEQFTDNNSMADDVAIAIMIRKAGYRTVICRDSYYIESMPALFNSVSKGIFQRRALAVTQTLMSNRDIMFNTRYSKFGLICYPLEFFMNILFPFIIFIGMAVAVICLLFIPVWPGVVFLGLFAVILSGFRHLRMAWYQMLSVVKYLLDPKMTVTRWTPLRH